MDKICAVLPKVASERCPDMEEQAQTKDVDPPQAPVRDRSRPSVWYRYVAQSLAVPLALSFTL